MPVCQPGFRKQAHSSVLKMICSARGQSGPLFHLDPRHAVGKPLCRGRNVARSDRRLPGLAEEAKKLLKSFASVLGLGAADKACVSALAGSLRQGFHCRRSLHSFYRSSGRPHSEDPNAVLCRRDLERRDGAQRLNGVVHWLGECRARPSETGAEFGLHQVPGPHQLIIAYNSPL